ncbi:MAG TPA: Rieske (2Fe-2S) protein [Myxococcales bacterium]
MADDLGRRALLRCGAACAVAACGKFVDEPVAIEAGAPVKGLLSVPMARVPELARQGGSVLLRANASDFLGRRVSVLVANTTSQGLRAYGAYCPHAGCEVAWVDRADEVVCPCHLSRFAVDGTVTHPPAAADLDTYSAKLSPDEQTLIVDLSGSAGVFPGASNGSVSFTVQQLPALAQVGASVTGHAAGVPFPLVVLRASATQVLAFDARCPHLGCAVRGAQKLFICPCHGSLFDLNGSVKLGPATSPLIALPVTFDGTHVVVKVPA